MEKKNQGAFGDIATGSSDIWMELKRCCHCMIPGIWGVQMGANYRIALKYIVFLRSRCLANREIFSEKSCIMNFMTQLLPPPRCIKKKCQMTSTCGVSYTLPFTM